MDPVKGTVLINTLAWLTTPFTGMLLKCFGRRTLLVAAYAAMAVEGVGMSIAVLTGHNNLMLVITCTFAITFQLAPGPVTWLYVAESCESKGVAAGTSVNLLFTLFISVTTNSFLNDWTKKLHLHDVWLL